jgi:TetR/AcrR family transcriptional regulator
VTREKILDVAEDLFARSGFSGVGLREVALRVGLSKSALFHHFPSKAALYQDVLVRVLGRIATAVGPALESDRDPGPRLEQWLDALVDALVEHPPAARLLLRALFEHEAAIAPAESVRSDVIESQLGALIDGFQRLVRAGIDSGDFRPLSLPDATQTMIGATICHFASGEFGEELMGGSLFTAESVRRRRGELKTFMRRGLADAPAEDTTLEDTSLQGDN